MDLLQRQVNWILWSVVTETALIIIPEEADIVIPLLFNAKDPTTHLLTYAAPVTRKMLHFNKLKYYTMPVLPIGWTPPTWLTTGLGIFAGRLYFEYEEYSGLQEYLGFREDGAVPSADEATMKASAQQAHSFTAKPLTFLQEWLAVRRKNQDFTHTPMGHICQGNLLKASHPFFAKPESQGAPGANTDGRSTSYGREESGSLGDMPFDELEEDDGDFDEEDEDELSEESERSG